MFPHIRLLIGLLTAAGVATAEPRPTPQPPPAPAVAPAPVPAAGTELRVGSVPEGLAVARVYAKHVSVGGFPVLGSAKVSDYALLEAGYLIGLMLKDRADVRDALIRNRVRFVVMAASEMTTDVPEHSDLTPKDYWDRRARGLGATSRRPAVSCGEENLLKLRGDPYAAENILIHEFAHAMHEMGLKSVDKTFDGRLEKAYQAAKEKGLWKGTYAATNRNEYWAEMVQSWFACNRTDDNQHNHVNSREDLIKYDPAGAELVAEAFRGATWVYVPPAKRTDKAHLAGLDVQKLPRFEWPERLKKPLEELKKKK
jgi:hypothetical protein